MDSARLASPRKKKPVEPSTIRHAKLLLNSSMLQSCSLNSSMWVIFSLGALIRLCIYHFTSVPDALIYRVELATPDTSLERAHECAYLLANSVPVYQLGLCRTSPLIVSLVGLAWRWGLENSLFIVSDLLAGYFIYQIAKYRIVSNSRNNSANEPLASLLPPVFYAALYLFNPFTLLCSFAKSLSVFNSLSIFFTIYCAVSGKDSLAMVGVAIASYISFYPIVLLIPCLLFAYHRNQKFSPSLAAIFLASLLGLFTISHGFFNDSSSSWSFLASTYGYLFSFAELRPNIGLAWYLFVEMFDHFRTFFLIVFQANLFIYLLPMSIKFRNDPFFLSFLLLAVSAIFKPYPTINDIAIYLMLFAQLGSKVLSRVKVLFVVLSVLALAMFLAPITWHFWIYQGSGNANFYFAVVLLHSGAQIILIANTMNAYLRTKLLDDNPGLDLAKVYQR